MLNKVILIGRLGATPEMRIYEGGKKMAWMDLATDRIYRNQKGKRQKQTNWHRLICYGALADFVYENLSKGKLLYVEGRLDYWGKDKSPVVVVEHLKVLDSKKKQLEPEQPMEPLANEIPEKDEIPF